MIPLNGNHFNSICIRIRMELATIYFFCDEIMQFHQQLYIRNLLVHSAKTYVKYGDAQSIEQNNFWVLNYNDIEI